MAWTHACVDWRPAILPLSRSECHYLEIEMRGVAARALERAVNLQLLQLTGIARVGFVFRVRNGKVAIWYWDEAKLTPEKTPGATIAQTRNGVAFWPETVLGQLPEQGLHLLQRSRGYEALAMEGGEIRRTRWFADLPDLQQWQDFARDAGHSAQIGSVPVPQPVALSRKVPKGWKLSSHFLAHVPLAALGGAILAAFLGAALLAMAVYQAKLERAIRAENMEIERISQENAVTFTLQKQIAARSAYLEQLRHIQPEVLQLELMQALAESGLVMEGEQQTSLLEWEYRNQQLRLLFAVPPALVLGDFLAHLETLPMLKEVRLLPDTPVQAVGIQATLLPWRAVPVNAAAKADRSPSSQEENPAGTPASASSARKTVDAKDAADTRTTP
ncbi:MAG: hypothetical protein LBR88_04725 [Zoogloeaceae bacterium]|jgi:hypothetical protein|nr:hypothetical protein [Zoogloeaceae bacterium]